MTEQQAWTLTEAAKECRHKDSNENWSDVSRKTLQRRLDKGKFPNAYRADGPKGEGTGPWMIPLADLLAEGFHPGGGRTFVTDNDASQSSQQSKTATPTESAPTELEELQSKLDKAEREHAEILRRAEVAEAIAEERGKALDDMRTTLRMLEAGDPKASTVSTETKEPSKLTKHDDSEPAPKARNRFQRWWSGE